MNSLIQITYRSFNATPAISTYIEAKAAKLDALATRMTGCRIAIEAPHRHHRHGRRYRVRIDLKVPGRELVVENPQASPSAEDVYACIDAAFDTAQRLLAEHSRRNRGNADRETPYAEE